VYSVNADIRYKSLLKDVNSPLETKNKTKCVCVLKKVSPRQHAFDQNTVKTVGYTI